MKKRAKTDSFIKNKNVLPGQKQEKVKLQRWIPENMFIERYLFRPQRLRDS